MPAACLEPPSPEESAKAKVKKALRDAEKKSIIFNLDLGPVPTINKDTLSGKVTVALSNKAKEGNHDYNLNDAKDTIDDVLSCSKLKFMGSSTRAYHNKLPCAFQLTIGASICEPRLRMAIFPYLGLVTWIR